MAKWCPVGVLVSCALTDPACQSYGQPYSVVGIGAMGRGGLLSRACILYDWCDVRSAYVRAWGLSEFRTPPYVIGTAVNTYYLLVKLLLNSSSVRLLGPLEVSQSSDYMI
jgi:hypothetical protein